MKLLSGLKRPQRGLAGTGRSVSARRVMTDAEATAFILAFLADGARRTTHEVEAATNSQAVQCPDSPVKFLMKLQLRGLIEGELDPKARGWVWWEGPTRRATRISQ